MKLLNGHKGASWQSPIQIIQLKNKVVIMVKGVFILNSFPRAFFESQRDSIVNGRIPSVNPYQVF
jgi:hypothetical protein